MLLNAESGSFSYSLSYTLTGSSAYLLKASHYRLQSAAGSYSFSGKDISTAIKVPPVALLSPSSYTLIGYASFSVRSRIINFNTSPGAYSYSLDYSLQGYAATLTAPIVRQINLIADSANLSLIGSSVSLNKFVPIILNAAVGSYPLAGEDISVVRLVSLLDSAKGSYQVSGSDALLVKPRNLVLSADSFVLSWSLDDYILEMFEAATLVLRTYVAPYISYNLTGYVANDPILSLEPALYRVDSAESYLISTRYLYSDQSAYNADFVVARLSQQYQYPKPEFVAADVIYGPEGQFIGTMQAVDKTNKFDIETGRFVKILSNKTVMSL